MSSVNKITARRASISRQIKNVRSLAEVRLCGDLQAQVQKATAETEW